MLCRSIIFRWMSRCADPNQCGSGRGPGPANRQRLESRETTTNHPTDRPTCLRRYDPATRDPAGNTYEVVSRITVTTGRCVLTSPDPLYTYEKGLTWQGNQPSYSDIFRHTGMGSTSGPERRGPCQLETKFCCTVLSTIIIATRVFPT